MQRIPDNIWEVLVKTIFPAFVTITVAIAVRMEKQRMKAREIVFSYIIGIGAAYLVGQYVHEKTTGGLATILIAVSTLLGKDLFSWFMFRFKLWSVLDSASKSISKKIDSIFK
jgi:hypothetical protein